MNAAVGIGAFAQGMAGGAMLGKRMKRLASENADEPSPFQRLFGKGGKDGAKGLGDTSPSQAVEKGRDLAPPSPSGQSYGTSDPVAEGMQPYQKAFLNAVAGGESGGRYNVRYTPKGGVDFEGFGQHPGIMEDGPHGPSSAAGRYQFTKSTWDEMGGGSFEPAMQDKRAWALAETRYKATTGRELGADLQGGGLTSDMLAALTPTWQAFGKNPERHIATYQDSMNRYQPSAPASAAAKGVGAAPKKTGALAVMERAYTSDSGIPARGINPYD